MSVRVGRFPRALHLSSWSSSCGDNWSLYTMEFECVKRSSGEKRRLRRINKDYFIDAGIIVDPSDKLQLEDQSA